MSPAQPKREQPIEKKVCADCEKAHQHRRVAFADCVKRRRQHFQRRIGGKANGIKLQRASSLSRHLGGEPAVLINHADDRQRKHRQSDRRRNGKQKRQPHSARKNRAKLSRVPERGALRHQRQRNCPDGHTKNSQRQLHQAKRNVEPAHRAISKAGCKSAVD